MVRISSLNRLSAWIAIAVVATICAQAQTSFGPVNLGSTSAAMTVTVPVTTAGTLGTISVGTQGAVNQDFVVATGGTCTVNQLYAAAATCTVNLTFAPKFAGSRSGAAVLADTAGNVMGTGFVAGMGMGPQVYYPTNPEMTPNVSGGTYFSFYMAPNALAVDGNGNIFYGNAGYAPNTVFKLTPSAPGSSTYTASALDANVENPLSLAVDGAGNVYCGSGGSWMGVPPQLLKYTLLPDGSYSAAQPLAVGQFADNNSSTLGGVAVDGSGNVFISDQFANAVYELKLQADGTYAPLAQIASGLLNAWGTAVDGNGNIYVATSDVGIVKLVPQVGGTYTSTVISSTTYANGVAVDGIGNVYFANYGPPVELALQPNGTYLERTLGNVESSLGIYSVAVDASGNLFVGDGNTGNVVEIPYATQPTLMPYASTAVGKVSTDSPQTFTIGNNGNMPLVFADIAYPVNFPEALGILGECPIGKQLLPNASCTLTINFQPSVSGPIADSLYISDNAQNMQYATQTINLNGTGTGVTRANAWWNRYAQITYGASLTNVLNATASVPGTFVYTTSKGVVLTPATILPAGNYILYADFTESFGAPMFRRLQQTPGGKFHRALQLTVLQAPLLVTPTDMTITYMSQVPTYQYTVSGLINGDTQAASMTGIPTINANATAPVRAGYIRGQVFITAPVGAYPLKSAWGSMLSSNYTFQFGTGTLTIIPATTPLTITARNVTVAKGAKFPTSLSYTMTGMLGMDSASTAGTGAPSITTTATAQSAPGTYTITASAGTFAAPNYSGVNYANGTLTIK